jgi:hypothetical protein
MIRSESEIIDLISQHKAVPQYITDARNYTKKLKALVYGKDFIEYLLKIEGIESNERAEARKKFSRSIKDLNTRLLRHLDNIYSASGGNKQYNISGESVKKELFNKIGNIRDGKSIEAWLKTYWIETLYHSDPSGLIFLEYKDENVYPTYKSIGSIRGYEPQGQGIEWVLFEPVQYTASQFNRKYNLTITEPMVTIWRYYDDGIDIHFKQNGEIFTRIDELMFINPFGKCPGLINSDLIDINDGSRLSPIDPIIEVESEILADQSIKTLYKRLKGFPKEARLGSLCPSCNGIGKIDNSICPDCKGQKYLKRADVTDEVIIQYPPKEGVNIPNQVAWFVSPDLETWKQYNEEIKLLIDFCNKTHWGSIFVEDDSETATGKFIDTQPVMNKLNVYSDVAEYMERQLTEWIVNFLNPNKKKDDPVCSIHYGRNFIIEKPDDLLKRYTDNKIAQAPIVVLDRQLTEYLGSKYKNDPENLRISLLKKDVEPYVHFTVEQVNLTFGAQETKKKVVFNDWWETVSNEVINISTSEQLSEQFEKWFIANYP